MPNEEKDNNLQMQPLMHDATVGENNSNDINDINDANDALIKPKKPTRQQRKVLKREAASVKRRLRLQVEIHDPATNLEPNPYMAKLQIKKLHRLICAGDNSDSKLFDFGLIAFYKSDADYIVPGEWLNDNNISFVYEMLSTYFIKQHNFGHQVYLLFPALVQLFLHYPVVKEIASILPMKELSKLKFVFIPFNFITESDVDLESANNGDHWALCLLNNAERKLLVYDSMSDDEDTEDDALLHKLASRLKSVLFKPSDSISIIKMKCGQQDNFDDCGVYLIMFSCYLVWMLMSGEKTDLDLSKVNFDAMGGRLAMMELVYKLTEAARKS